MNNAAFLAPRLIRASAGSGKTYELSSRYIGLLARGEKPERILATTFTRKAAGEIQERVFRRLAEAALDDDAARMLAKDMALPGFTRSDALSSLRRLIASQHRLNICTLDSFFVNIARSFALELGLSPQWRIPDSFEDAQSVRRSVAALCRRADPEKTAQLLRLLNGDNLTRAVHRSMVQQANDFYETFKSTTADAWDWLKVPRGLSKDEISLLSDSFQTLPLPSTQAGTPDKNWSKAHQSIVECLALDDWKGLLGNGLVIKMLKGESAYNKRPIPPEFIEVLSGLSRHAASVLLGRIAGHNRAAREVLELYHREFKEERSLSSTLGFSEIKELLASEALGQNLVELYYRLDSHLGHLLLDEFQDTSRLEWTVLEPICAEILSQSGGDQSFFCVGDVKQAIYGWRGGVAEIFDTLQNKWQHLEPEYREVSRRCCPAVIDAVNRTFEGLKTNAALAEQPQAAAVWQERFKKHLAHNQELSGYVRLEGVSASDEDEDCERPILQRAALLVRELSLKWPSISIGVLVRKNDTVGRMIEELSARAPGLEVSEEGGNPLTDSSAVEVLLSLLVLIDHPADSVAHFCVKTSSLAGHTELEGIENLGRLPAISAALRRSLFEKGCGRFIFEFASELLPQCGPRDAQRLMQLVELAYSRESEVTSRPYDFVEYVRREKIEYTSTARVRVMTVHKAKGLEFDAVILPELDESLIGNLQRGLLEFREKKLEAPLRVSRFVSEELRFFARELAEMYEQTASARVEEALSLLYVAMTRPRHALYMLIRAVKSTEAPLTYASILAQALAEGRREAGTLFERGSDDLSAVQAERFEELRNSEPERVRLSPVVLSSTAGGRHRGSIRQSPSELEGGALVNLKHALNLEGAQSASRGKVIHALFEKIDWLDDGEPASEELERAAAGAESAGLNKEELISEFRSMLSNGEISTGLKRNSYAHWGADELEAQRERRFVIRRGSVILSGAFDRLVIGRKSGKTVACEVIDFKTDRFSSNDAQGIKERAEYYRPQLEAYREAASRITGLSVEKISTRLFFVSAGVSVVV